MTEISWLLIGAAITALGIFGFKLAKRWREEGREPNIDPPYYN